MIQLKLLFLCIFAVAVDLSVALCVHEYADPYCTRLIVSYCGDQNSCNGNAQFGVSSFSCTADLPATVTWVQKMYDPMDTNCEGDVIHTATGDAGTCTDNGFGRYFKASCAEDVACLHADSTVQLESGRQLFLSSLTKGDRVLSVLADGTPFYDTVTESSGNYREMTRFTNVTTKDGHSILVTPRHYLHVNNASNRVPAGDIRVGDRLLVLSEGTVKHSLVSSVSSFPDLGVHTIRTAGGRIVVDGVVASDQSQPLTWTATQHWKIKFAESSYYLAALCIVFLSSYFFLSSAKQPAAPAEGGRPDADS